MFDDMTPRYAPDKVMSVFQGKWGMLPVIEAVTHPPGHNSPVIKNDITALELKTECGSRWFGCDHAYINSELRIVVVGTISRDEVRSKWEVVPEALR